VEDRSFSGKRSSLNRQEFEIVDYLQKRSARRQVELGDCRSHQIPQSRPSGPCVINEGGPHAGIPELLQVIGDAGDGLIAGIGSEEVGDLIGHVNQALGLHG
jgi:hypothetical protein